MGREIHKREEGLLTITYQIRLFRRRSASTLLQGLCLLPGRHKLPLTVLPQFFVPPTLCLLSHELQNHYENAAHSATTLRSCQSLRLYRDAKGMSFLKTTERLHCSKPKWRKVKALFWSSRTWRSRGRRQKRHHWRFALLVDLKTYGLWAAVIRWCSSLWALLLLVEMYCDAHTHSRAGPLALTLRPRQPQATPP